MNAFVINEQCGTCGSHFAEQIEDAVVGSALLEVAMAKHAQWQELHEHLGELEGVQSLLSSGVGGQSLRDDDIRLASDFLNASNRMRDRLFTKGSVWEAQSHPAFLYWSDLLDKVNRAAGR